MKSTIKNKILHCFGLLLAIGILLFKSCEPAYAQTNTVDTASFFSTAEYWITHADTNFTFEGVSLEASTGYKQQVGVNAANYVTAQYDLNRFNLGADIQFSGFGSPVNQIEGQLGYAVIDHFSIKLDADVRFGYNTLSESAVIEPALVLKKKLTTNTYAEMGISLPEFFNQKEFNTSPSFVIGGGFTY